MRSDALSDFIEQSRSSFGPLTTELITAVREQLEQLTRAPVTERWLQELYRESPASRELYRDAAHGFMLLAHSEPTGLYRPPHDHGQSWVIYALARGEMEIGTFVRIEDAHGEVRLVKRDATLLRAGDARIYLPGDIHDTRCSGGPSLLLRFTERDLKVEEREHRLTRYVARDGVWTVASP
jgi:hypothetical protein